MKRLNKFLFFIAIFVFTLPHTLFSKSDPKIISPSIVCTRTHAFNIDKDPKGLNLRAGPGTQYPSLDTIPPENEKSPEGPPVDVLGSSGSWLYVEIPGYYGEEKALKGWVYASKMGTFTKQKSSVKLLKEPNATSAEVIQIPAHTRIELLSCQKDWLQINYNQQKGWISHSSQCFFYDCDK